MATFDLHISSLGTHNLVHIKGVPEIFSSFIVQILRPPTEASGVILLRDVAWSVVRVESSSVEDRLTGYAVLIVGAGWWYNTWHCEGLDGVRLTADVEAAPCLRRCPCHRGLVLPPPPSTCLGVQSESSCSTSRNLSSRSRYVEIQCCTCSNNVGLMSHFCGAFQACNMWSCSNLHCCLTSVQKDDFKWFTDIHLSVSPSVDLSIFVQWLHFCNLSPWLSV